MDTSVPFGTAQTNGIQTDTDRILPKHATLQDLKSNIRVTGIKPNEELLSASRWEDLHLSPELLKGIYAKGFEKPSKIQESALPIIVGKKNNLVAQAQNGSGKTASFALAMLSTIQTDIPYPQALCLCPTRELARQNLNVIEELGRYTAIRCFLVVPQCGNINGAAMAQILVGTPGKMFDLLKRRTIAVDAMKMLVLDEADQMIDIQNNMSPQVQQIRQCFPQHLQILLFSATYSDTVMEFAKKIVPNAYFIVAERETLSLSCIQQYYITCESDIQKFTVLSHLYGSLTIGQSVIFVKSRQFAFELAQRMQSEGHAVSLICGTQSRGEERMDPAARDAVMSEFRNGETKVLICTDLLSRGIDVPQVTLVINYDLPYMKIGTADEFVPQQVNMETYIHRVGRTGRFGLNGVAVNLVTPQEASYLSQIEHFYGCKISQISQDPNFLEEKLRQLRAG